VIRSLEHGEVPHVNDMDFGVSGATTKAPLARRLQLMRVIIPSWRFFDQPDEPLLLETRVNTKDAWIPLLTPRRRPFYAVIFNPGGNLRFAMHALLEQFISDLEDGDEIAIDVSSALVQNLVKQQLTERGVVGPKSFQFRIRTTTDVLFTSEACPLH
jgi:hypothetical protein